MLNMNFISSSPFFWKQLLLYSVFSILVLSKVSADFFSCSIKDHVIKNGIYKNFTTENSINCIAECQIDENCVSYNYEYEPNHGSSGHICQLSRCDTNGTLIKKKRFWSHQVRISKNNAINCNVQNNKKKKLTTYDGLDASAILANRTKYLKDLINFLGPKHRVWKRCYRSGSQFSASAFHNLCDSKGPTLTIIRVGNFTFGGYIDKSLKLQGETPCVADWITSDQAFLFSLYNYYDGYKPRKFLVQVHKKAAFYCKTFGPCFANDLCIRQGQKRSYSSSMAYEVPPSCKFNSKCSFFSGQLDFTPSDVEVFYELK